MMRMDEARFGWGGGGGWQCPLDVKQVHNCYQTNEGASKVILPYWWESIYKYVFALSLPNNFY